MYTVVAAPFLRSTLERKPYVLLRLEASTSWTKKNMLGKIFYDNCKLFFADYFFVRLLQGVIKDNFPLLITASNLSHNLVQFS